MIRRRPPSHGRPFPITAIRSNRDGLKGAIIGVLHEAYDRETADPEVIRVFQQAIADLRRAGATVIDPATVEGYSASNALGRWPLHGLQVRSQRFPHCPRRSVPMHSLAEIIKSGKFHHRSSAVSRKLKKVQRTVPIPQPVPQTTNTEISCATLLTPPWTN